MTVLEPTTRRWTRTEYMRLADEGWFTGQRVQLIEGDIIQMPRQGHKHCLALHHMYEYLRGVYEPGHWIRLLTQLDFGPDSQPEPDIAVAEHDVDFYNDHPTSALLAVEISDSSLRLDKRKANLYAAAGIPEYWMVDLSSRSVLVHRLPVVDPKMEFGHRYDDVHSMIGSQRIAPMAKPEAMISIENFFE
jgi:Uma2 family endonuclease